VFDGVTVGLVVIVGVGVGVAELEGVGGIEQSTQLKSNKKYLSFKSLKLC